MFHLFILASLPFLPLFALCTSVPTSCCPHSSTHFFPNLYGPPPSTSLPPPHPHPSLSHLPTLPLTFLSDAPGLICTFSTNPPLDLLPCSSLFPPIPSHSPPLPLPSSTLTPSPSPFLPPLSQVSPHRVNLTMEACPPGQSLQRVGSSATPSSTVRMTCQCNNDALSHVVFCNEDGEFVILKVQ